MALTKLEHYLVISDDIEETRRFYCDALGMRVGFRPELEFDGYWLYVGDVPCIHVAERESYKRYSGRFEPALRKYCYAFTIAARVFGNRAKGHG
ncbi:MAG: VOC family protein [Gammaproteobacteria bacterium]